MRFQLGWTSWLATTAATVALLASGSASALPQLITFPTGNPQLPVVLLGAIGVQIGNDFYDVNFVDGTCVDLFGGCDNAAEDFLFPSQALADQAAQALLDQVFVDGPDGGFDSAGIATNGCGSPAGFTLCQTLTPYALLGTRTIRTASANNSFSEANDAVSSPLSVAYATDTTIPTGGGDRTWAVWSPSIIPEPGTGLLMGLGLAGLAAGRKRAA